VGERQLQMGTPEDETLGADCDLVVSNKKYGKNGLHRSAHYIE